MAVDHMALIYLRSMSVLNPYFSNVLPRFYIQEVVYAFGRPKERCWSVSNSGVDPTASHPIGSGLIRTG